LKTIFKKTLSILTPKERKKFWLLIILDIFINIADIAFLASLLFVVHFYTQDSFVNKSSFLPFWLLNRNSLFLITLFFILYSLKNIVSYLAYRTQCKFIGEVSSRLSQLKLVAYLEQEGYTNYVNTDSTAQIRKTSYDPAEFCKHVLWGFQQISTQFILILLAIITIIIFDARLFLLLFSVLVPPAIIIFYLIKKKLHLVEKNAKITNEKSMLHLQEALMGFVESNIYEKKNFFVDRYMKYQRRFNKQISDLLTIQGLPSRIIEVFALLGILILLAINSWLDKRGIAMLTISAFIIAAYRIIPGIVKILNLISQINVYKYTIDNILPKEKNYHFKDSSHNTSHIESIEFKNICFKYNNHPILNNLNFTINYGDFIGFSGSSGKGKTTILNLLLGFLTPHSGEIIFNNILTNTPDQQQYWKRIAYVKQQSFFIHDSIINNIILDSSYNEEKLQKVVQISGITNSKTPFAEGIHTIITENGKNISGGQRQRIAIARALYKNADLIILDEPFNELDEESEIILLNYFKALSQKGKTIILITHHQKSLMYCNKVVSLNEIEEK